MRALAMFGDSITTDHISPAGSIKATSPAGKYLRAQVAPGLQPVRHAARQPRGDDARHLRQHPHQEPDGARAIEGGVTKHWPDRRADVDLRRGDALQGGGVPLVVFAGKEYGTGSSRDWAAKGTNLLGVRAVIAESFERIHRSNLVGMGVGLPAPHICDYWKREDTAANYDDGSTFQIGRIDMVANTGTYLDTPFHRYAEGDDLAAVGLERLAGLDGLCVRAGTMEAGAELFEGFDVAGKAVLVHTGWDRHWRTDSYSCDHPFLTEAAARLLAERGAALVGIDSYNIDDTRARRRPSTPSCSAPAS
jgi:hypothetical protein